MSLTLLVVVSLTSSVSLFSLLDISISFVTNTANIIWEDIPLICEKVSTKELNKLDIEEILSLLEKEIEKNNEKYKQSEEEYNSLEKENKKLDKY